MKKVIVFLLLSLLLVGCKNKNLPDTFGAELYNGSFLVYEGNEDPATYNIVFMSTINIPDNPTIELSYSGGKFEHNIKLINVGKSDIGEYIVYDLTMDLSKLSFDKDMIQIDCISIYYDTDKCIELKPQRFDISKIDETEKITGITENMDLFYSGMSSKGGDKIISTTIEVNNKVTINEIVFSNEVFEVMNEDAIYGKEFDEGRYDVEVAVKDGTGELNKYTEYLATYVIKYSVDGKEYTHVPLYMPIAYGGDLDEYYDEVLNLQFAK